MGALRFAMLVALSAGPALAAEAAPRGPASDYASVIAIMGWEQGARDRLHRILAAVPLIPSELIKAIQVLKAEQAGSQAAVWLALLAGLVAVGIGLERHVRRSRWRHWGGARHVLPIALFSAAITPLYFALSLPPLLRLVVGSGLVAFVLYRLLAAAIEHGAQQGAHRRLKVTLATLLCGWSATVVMMVVDADPAVVNAMEIVTAGIVLLLAVEFLWSRPGWTRAVRTALSLYLLLVWLLWCADLHMPFWLGLYAIALPPVLSAVSAKARHHAGARGLDKGTSTLAILIVLASRSAVVMLALAWLLHVWSVHRLSLGYDKAAADAVLYGIVKSVFVLLLAELLWQLSKAAIDRHLTATHLTAAPEGASEDLSDAHATRLHTLLPVLRNLLAVGLLGMTVLTLLGQFGFDIAPLIAGAGIVGVAVGFGSQTLVRDVISGVFYLLDDAFRVGEYIQAKDYKGTVEGFSLRSVKLRHHRGPLFTVPFGDLGAVENMSRDWSKLKLLITLPYDANLDVVRKIGKSVGQRLLDDPEFGHVFVEPLKMKGVEEFGQFGIVVSFSMITLPTSQQGFIRRTAYAMLRTAFQDNGVAFAQPTIQLGNKESS